MCLVKDPCQRTQAFSGLQSHYLFDDQFGRPDKGNDKGKGKVEGVVGHARRNFMVPVPRFESWEAFNADLAKRCHERGKDVLRGHRERIGERFGRDQEALMALPPDPFDTDRLGPGSFSPRHVLVSFRSGPPGPALDHRDGLPARLLACREGCRRVRRPGPSARHSCRLPCPQPADPEHRLRRRLAARPADLLRILPSPHAGLARTMGPARRRAGRRTRHEREAGRGKHARHAAHGRTVLDAGGFDGHGPCERRVEESVE